MLVTGGEDVCKGPCHEPSFYHVDQVVPHRMLIDLIVSVTQYTFFILQIHIIGVRFVKKFTSIVTLDSQADRVSSSFMS